MSDCMQRRRCDPARNMRRFYVLAVHADLVTGWSLVREWGRIGRPGRVRIEAFPELEQAQAAGARIEHKKRRRGYQ
jgi:predicted DNA-binding WGR domain protein